MPWVSVPSLEFENNPIQTSLGEEDTRARNRTARMGPTAIGPIQCPANAPHQMVGRRLVTDGPMERRAGRRLPGPGEGSGI